MSERLKMILKVLALFALAILIGVGLYYAFLRAPRVATEPVLDESGTIGGLPQSGEGTLPTGEDADGDENGSDALPASETAQGGATITTRLTNSEVVNATVMQNGSLAYYDPADGRFYSIDNGGEVQSLGNTAFPEAETVVFNAAGSAAVLEFPDGSNVVYDFSAARQTTLPSHWEAFSFSSDGTQLAAKSIGVDPSNRALILAAADGSTATAIAALGDNDDKVDVNWSPSGTIVAFSATGGVQSGFGRQELYLIGLDGEATGNLIIEGSDFSAIWSPNGSNILYSVADAGQNYRPSLWYADSRGDRNGDTRVRLPVETWVEKCVFASSSTIYCAVPKTMVDGGGSDHGLVTAADNLYQIDLPSGRATLLGYAAVDTQMFNLSVSPDGRTLYFQDERGRLTSMRLK